MSLSLPNVEATGSATGSGALPITSASFTPPAFAVLFAIATVQTFFNSSDPTDDLTIADSLGLFWELVGGQGDTISFSQGTRVWRANVGAAPASMAVTVSNTGFTPNAANLTILSYTGQNVSVPAGNPDGFLRGAGFPNDDGSGPWSFNLAVNPGVTSEVVCVLSSNASAPSSASPGSGWTEIIDNGAEFLVAIQVRRGSASPAVDWADASSVHPTYKNVAFCFEVEEGTPGERLYGPAPIVGTDNDVMGDVNGYQATGSGFKLFVDDSDNSGGWYCPAFRFDQVDLTGIGTLISATLKFQRPEDDNGASGTVRIKCQDSNAPAVFSDGARPYNRAVRGAFVDFDFPLTDGPETDAVDVTDLVQDLLDAGFTYSGASGDAIAFIMGAFQQYGITAVSWRSLAWDVSNTDGNNPATLEILFDTSSPPAPGDDSIFQFTGGMG